MNKQQQELYEKLLKKVNEYCLGQAAEDVIEAIDDLVDTYETPKEGPVPPLEALKEFTNNQYKDKNAYDDELLKTVETTLKEYTQLKIDYEELNDIHNKLVGYKNRERDNVVKKLKALDIIKEKLEPFVENYRDLGYTLECDMIAIGIPQEEYELLKEVLK